MGESVHLHRDYFANWLNSFRKQALLGLSYANMAPTTAINGSLSTALNSGGSVAVLWGWFIVAIISCAVAASLAEMCSAFPHAAGASYLLLPHSRSHRIQQSCRRYRSSFLVVSTRSARMGSCSLVLDGMGEHLRRLGTHRRRLLHLRFRRARIGRCIRSELRSRTVASRRLDVGSPCRLLPPQCAFTVSAHRCYRISTGL